MELSLLAESRGAGFLTVHDAHAKERRIVHRYAAAAVLAFVLLTATFTQLPFIALAAMALMIAASLSLAHHVGLMKRTAKMLQHPSAS